MSSEENRGINTPPWKSPELSIDLETVIVGFIDLKQNI